MSIATELLELIPNDDTAYIALVRRLEQAGYHPAVAAVQAHKDLHVLIPKEVEG